MITALRGLSELEIAFISLVGIAIFFLGYKLGFFMSAGKYKKLLKSQEQESYSSSKSLKKLMEDEKEALFKENETLKENNTVISEKLENYRKKIAGMGLLSFGGGKKRSDILYSLLMENEALEHLLVEQGEKLVGERQEFLQHRLKDIGKRQRLIAELFNDDTIKDYVRDVMSDDDRVKAAFSRAEKVEGEDEIKKLTEKTRE